MSRGKGFGCGDKLRSREPRSAAGIIAAQRTQVEGSSMFYSLDDAIREIFGADARIADKTRVFGGDANGFLKVFAEK